MNQNKYILLFEYILKYPYFQIPGLDKIITPGIAIHSSKKSTDYKELERKYFSQLTENKLQKLLDIYIEDFLQFNYTYDHYINYVYKT